MRRHDVCFNVLCAHLRQLKDLYKHRDIGVTSEGCWEISRYNRTTRGCDTLWIQQHCVRCVRCVYPLRTDEKLMDDVASRTPTCTDNRHLWFLQQTAHKPEWYTHTHRKTELYQTQQCVCVPAGSSGSCLNEADVSLLTGPLWLCRGPWELTSTRRISWHALVPLSSKLHSALPLSCPPPRTQNFKENIQPCSTHEHHLMIWAKVTEAAGKHSKEITEKYLPNMELLVYTLQASITHTHTKHTKITHYRWLQSYRDSFDLNLILLAQIGLGHC